MGDSSSDEYQYQAFGNGSIDPDTGQPRLSRNWLEQLVQYRGLNFGALGAFPFPRNQAYEFNWALYGATSTTMIATGEHTGLAGQVAQGKVKLAFMFIGANDFGPFGTGKYNAIATADPGFDLTAYTNSFIANVTTAIDAVLAAGDVKLVMFNVPDYGYTPYCITVAGYDAVQRQRVADALNNVVNPALEQLAQSRYIPFVDLNGAGAAVRGPHANLNPTVTIGGVAIDLLSGSQNPHTAFVHDKVHPDTIPSGLIANLAIKAINVAYGDSICPDESLVPFTDQELLTHAGIGGEYVGETFTNNADLAPYIKYLPPPPTAFSAFSGLGDLPGGTFTSEARGVSDDGTVVVGRGRSGSGDEAFRWSACHAEMVGLGDLAGGSFSSKADGVSADGSVVVGQSSSTSGLEAFRWTSAGMTGLGDLAGGAFVSDAFATSADGSVIVGLGSSGSGAETIRWTQGGGMVGLGDLPGGAFECQAYGVSADGSVAVGYGNSSSGRETIRWTEAGGMVGLGDLPGDGLGSSAYGVSADGSVIVGYGNSASGSEAARWTFDGASIQGLGDLPGGIFSSLAQGVSRDGSVVVGNSAADSPQQAFIWDAARGMRDLWCVLTQDYGVDLTGWLLADAKAVSADGRTIVGTGTNPSSNQEAWRVVLPPGPGDILVTDSTLAALLRVSPTTGLRSVVSSATVGGGTIFSSPVGLAIEPGGKVLVVDAGLDAVLRVDGATGNRTVVSSASVGSGTSFSNPVGIALESNGNIVVADGALAAVVRVDPATGNRTVLGGSGPALVSLKGVAVESTGTLLVVDDGLDAVVRVNPTTGNRAILSSSSTGTGPAFGVPKAIALDADGDILVADDGLDAVVQVDPVSGNRTVLSSASTGTGTNLAVPTGLAVGSDGSVLVTDTSLGAVMSAAQGSGNRTTLSSAAVGYGPAFSSPSGVAVVPSSVFKGGDPIIVDMDPPGVLRVDPVTGNRTMISSTSGCHGSEDAFGVGAFSIEMEKNGQLIVSQNGSHTLFRVDPATGNRTAFSQYGDGKGINFLGPRGLAIKSDGHILFTSESPQAIFDADPAGNRTIVSSLSVGAAEPQLGSPQDVAIDSAGNVDFVDGAKKAVFALNLSNGDRTLVSASSNCELPCTTRGTGLGTGNTDLIYPWRLVFEADGDILVADYGPPAKLVRVDPATGDRTILSDAGHGSGPMFGSFTDVSVEANGQILLAGGEAGGVLRVDPTTGDRTLLSAGTNTSLSGAPRGSGPNLYQLRGIVLAAVTDSDGDGILDDGDASGIVGDNPCMGGNTTGCDDNCRVVVNANQANYDGDVRGDLCDVDDDDDGLVNAVETGTGTFVGSNDTGTNSLNPDTDGDGYSDGAEVAAGTNPNDPGSSPSGQIPTLGGLGAALLVAALLAAGRRVLRRR